MSFITTAPFVPAIEQCEKMNGTRRDGGKSTHKCSKIFGSWNFRSTSSLKRGSMELFLLISLTIAPTIFAMTLPVNAASTTIAEVNGQLNICHTPVPCFTATLQANASGPDPEELTGMLLVYRAPGMAAAPRQPCVASVTGEVTSPMDAPTARLTGTLDPAQPAGACAGGCVCAGGLQGLSVTLFVDAVFGTMQLTTVTAAGYTEPLGSGSGTLTITQLGQST